MTQFAKGARSTMDVFKALKEYKSLSDLKTALRELCNMFSEDTDLACPCIEDVLVHLGSEDDEVVCYALAAIINITTNLENHAAFRAANGIARVIDCLALDRAEESASDIQRFSLRCICNLASAPPNMIPLVEAGVLTHLQRTLATVTDTDILLFALGCLLHLFTVPVIIQKSYEHPKLYIDLVGLLECDNSRLQRYAVGVLNNLMADDGALFKILGLDVLVQYRALADSKDDKLRAHVWKGIQSIADAASILLEQPASQEETDESVFRIQIAALTKQNAGLRAQHRELVEAKDKAEDEALNLRHELKDAQADIKALSSSAGSSNEKFTVLRNEISALKKELAESRHTEAEGARMVEQYREELARATQQAETIEQVGPETEAKVNGLTAEVARLDGLVRQLEDDLAARSKELDRAVVAKGQVESRVSQLSKQLTAERKKGESLAQTDNDAAARIKQLTAELNIRDEDDERRVEAHNAEVESLHARILAMDEQLASLTKGLADAEERARQEATRARRAGVLASDTKLLETKLEEAKQRALKALQGEKDACGAAERYRLEVEALGAAQDRVSTDSASARKAYEARLDALTGQNQRYAESIEGLQNDLHEQVHRAEAAEAALKTAREKAGQAEAEARRIKASIKASAGQDEEASLRIAALTKELDIRESADAGRTRDHEREVEALHMTIATLEAAQVQLERQVRDQQTRLDSAPPFAASDIKEAKRRASEMEAKAAEAAADLELALAAEKEATAKVLQYQAEVAELSATAEKREAALTGNLSHVQLELGETADANEVLRNELREHRDRIQNLVESAKELEAARDSAVAEKDRLEAKVSSLIDQSGSEQWAHDRIAALEHEMEVRDQQETARVREESTETAKLSAKLVELQREHDEAVERLAVVQLEAGTVKGELKEAVVERDCLSTELGDLQARYDALIAQTNSSDSLATAATTRITELEHEIAVRDADDKKLAAEHEKSISKLEGALATVESERDELAEKVESLNADLRDRQAAIESVAEEDAPARVVALEAEVERLNAELEKTKAAETAATEQSMALSDEIRIREAAEVQREASHSMELAGLEAKVLEQNAKVEELEETASNLVSDNENLREMAETALADKETLKATLDATTAELEAAQANQESIAGADDDAMQRIMALETELALRDKEQEAKAIDSLSLQEKLTAELDQATRALEQVTAEAEAYKTDLAEAADHMEQMEGFYKAQIEQLESSDDGSAEKIAELKNELENQVKYAREELSGRDSRIAELMASIEALNDDLEEKQRDVNYFRTLYDTVSGNLTQLKQEVAATAEVEPDDDGSAEKIAELKAELERQVSHAHSEVEARERRIADLEKAVEELKEAAEEKQRDVNYYRTLHNEVAENLAQATATAGAADDGSAAKIAELQAELERITEYYHELLAEKDRAVQEQQVVDDSEEVTATLRREVARLTAELEAVEEISGARATAAGDSAAAALDRVRELTRELESQATYYQELVQEKVERIEELEATTTAERDGMSDAVIAVQQERDGLRDSARQLQAEVDSLERQVADAGDTIAILKKELDTQTRTATEEVKELESTIEELRQQLADGAVQAQQAKAAADEEKEALMLSIKRSEIEVERYKDLATMDGLQEAVTVNLREADDLLEETIKATAPRSTPAVPDSVLETLRRREALDKGVEPPSARKPPIGRPARRSFTQIASRHAQRMDELEAETARLQTAKQQAAEADRTRLLSSRAVSEHPAVSTIVSNNVRLAHSLQSGETTVDVPQLVRDIKEVAPAFPRAFVVRRVPTDDGVQLASNVAKLAVCVALSPDLACEAYSEEIIATLGDMVSRFHDDVTSYAGMMEKPLAAAIACYALHCLSSLTLQDGAEFDLIDSNALPALVSYIPDSDALAVIADPLILSTFTTSLQVAAAVATCERGRSALMALDFLEALDRLLEVTPVGSDSTAMTVRRYAVKCLRNMALGNSVRPQVNNSIVLKLKALLDTCEDDETLRFVSHIFAILSTVASRRHDLAEMGVVRAIASLLYCSDGDAQRNCVAFLLGCSAAANVRAVVSDPNVVAGLVCALSNPDHAMLRLTLRLLTVLVLHKNVSYDSLLEAAGEYPVIGRLVEILECPEPAAQKYATRLLAYFYSGDGSRRTDAPEARAAFLRRTEALAALQLTINGEDVSGLTAVCRVLPKLLTGVGRINILAEAGQLALGLCTTGPFLATMLAHGLAESIQTLMGGLYNPMVRSFGPDRPPSRPSSAMSAKSGYSRISTASTTMQMDSAAGGPEIQRAYVAFTLALMISENDDGLERLTDVEDPFHNLGLDTLVLVYLNSATPAVSAIRDGALALFCRLAVVPSIAEAIIHEQTTFEVEDGDISVLETAVDMAMLMNGIGMIEQSLRLLDAIASTDAVDLITQEDVINLLATRATTDDEHALAAAVVLTKMDPSAVADAGSADAVSSLIASPQPAVRDHGLRIVGKILNIRPESCDTDNIMAVAMEVARVFPEADVDSVIGALGRGATLELYADHAAAHRLTRALLISYFESIPLGHHDPIFAADLIAWLTSPSGSAGLEEAVVERVAKAAGNAVKFMLFADCADGAPLIEVIKTIVTVGKKVTREVALVLVGNEAVSRSLLSMADKRRKPAHPLRKQVGALFTVLTGDAEVKRVMRSFEPWG
ncbi:Bacterial chemotaxis sensory transducers domain [Carpediemonas membranifera]|uniref:Bacterial chemotaxis sensory transducers domain n=1 Tax=Carpediemonas membranifera TaxID=201153 RepID=A0A8J6AVE2_9EUKA|nr:Bacterial chemotaxis sensory transducers domain [Carpediemonas membranifera]|eukprot:KAG9392550.1 Bacterial chemotaxis sensory transducers domain [Carpediemonas membranifera]